MNFLSLCPFSDFLFDFYLIFINIFFTKIAKKGNILPAGDDCAPPAPRATLVRVLGR